MSSSKMPEESQRVALVVQYLGTHFYGWQRQPERRTVQEEIERAIASVTGSPATLHGAGRTDSGVHAAAQVAHFNVASPIPPEKWAAVLNTRLPDDVAILASAEVSPTWHARFSATSRRYRYTLYTASQPNLFIAPFCWHYYLAPLEESLIQSAVEPLVGRHHLAAFRRAGSRRQHSWVDVQEVECYRKGPFVYFEIQASGFLYGMVRLLVGMLVEVGCGRRSLANFTDIWVNQRREQVKYSAPAKGLCLVRVGYPESPFPPTLGFDSQPQFVFSA
ncbi:MAG: tRNA pseudouridine(38-40) synthase TruA [Cyanobacteriota bacterium]|nr:tRNA pseudouridine(38-40) synthase TruA [Cyanobacteriota bacterium]